MGRVSKKYFVKFPLLSCVIILILVNLFQFSIYRVVLSIPIRSLQIYSANILINEKNIINYNIFNPFNFSNDIATENNYDDKLVEKIEGVIVRGEKCTKECMNLAKLIQEFPENWDLNRWSNYLNSTEAAKNIYVLEILKGSKKILFLNRVLQLSQAENLEVSNTALALLNIWGIQSSYDIPRTQVF